MNLANVGPVKVLKPTPPSREQHKSPLSSAKQGSRLKPTPPKANTVLQKTIPSEPPKFAIVMVVIDRTEYEFETNDNGFINLAEIQRFAPQAVGLCYISDEQKRRVLPITNDGLEIKPPRGQMGWSTSKEYQPVLPHFIKVAMTPRPATPPTQPNSLLDGVYDEEKNRREFQEAVMAFRNAGKAKTEIVTSRPTTRSDTASIQAEPQEPPQLDLKFEPNLSALDRLYLEKMRKEQREEKTNVLSLENESNKVQESVVPAEVQEKLDEIARERAEIRQMFTSAEPSDQPVAEVDFDETCSSRTITPPAAEISDKLEGISLGQIASLPIDIDVKQLQDNYKPTQKRPRTGIPSSRPSTGRSRPVTPGTHWNSNASHTDTTPVDISSNSDWKYRQSTWSQPPETSSDPTTLHENEEAAFVQLSREIIQNTPSRLLESTYSRQNTVDSDCLSQSRPSTACSTIVDPVEMQNIENAFMLHDDEY